MSEKNIPDFIQSLLESKKGFMKVKDIPETMSFDMKRKLGLMKKNASASTIKRVLEPLIADRFIFTKKGSVLYLLIPCDPSELVINALNVNEAVSPKVIAKDLPFSTSDFLEILNELSESGRIKIILNDKFEARIMLSEGHEEKGEREIKSSGEYTRERFKRAFDELERGRIFVNIPELRKRLNWPHDVFDDMIRELRDEGIVQLHKTDLTRFKPEDFFYDEENARRGMVTWNEQ